MFDYLVESVAISFIFGGILGGILAAQIVRTRPISQRSSNDPRR